ncbi:MAG: DUF1003 domain-containing protein [Eubacteriales bacterium]
MTGDSHDTSPCPVCREQHSPDEMMPFELIDDPLVEFIQNKYPAWSSYKSICLSCLNRIRTEYVKDVLEAEKGELSGLEQEVIKSLAEHDLLSRNINLEFEQKLTTGQRVADKVAEFGGSWRFIILFGGTIVIWIILNTAILLRHPFDPYPYILLNLVLSCLAALQAPIIMMSQNRQAEKDRLQADHDYRTNLKAELEIRHLNWKVDQLLMHHWQRLMEIQRIQTELMQEIASQTKRESSS